MRGITDNREVYTAPDCLLPGLDLIGWTRFTAAQIAGLREHGHSRQFEITLFRRGSANWCVEDVTYELSSNDLFVTRPGERHGGLDGLQHRCEFFWMQIDLPVVLTSMNLQAGEIAKIEESFSSTKSRLYKAGRPVQRHFRQLLAAHRDRTVWSRTEATGAVCLLIAELARMFTSQNVCEVPENGNLKRIERIQQVQQWVEANFCQSVTVRELARRSGLGVTQFRIDFKRVTGLSPSEFILKCRLQRGVQLLCETKASITEISHDLGFSSSQHFSNRFRELHGCSPSQFRDNRRARTADTGQSTARTN